jgi:hypothetical protein
LRLAGIPWSFRVVRKLADDYTEGNKLVQLEQYVGKVLIRTVAASVNSTIYFWAMGSPCPARATGRAARRALSHGQTGAMMTRIY